MRLLPLATLLALSLAFSCKEEPRPEDIAGRQAKAYYGHLLARRCGLFAAGIHDFDSLPAAYREQLHVSARQLAARLRGAHGGVCEVRLARAVADSAARGVNAFLVLCYADSTKEEIVVPMAERSPGQWRMK